MSRTTLYANLKQSRRFITRYSPLQVQCPKRKKKEQVCPCPPPRVSACKDNQTKIKDLCKGASKDKGHGGKFL